MAQSNTESPRSIERGTTRKPQRQYSVAEKYAALKILQSNLYNYEKTARDVGVTGTTIRKWRGQHPEVFNNAYRDKELITIEKKMANESNRLINSATELASLALKQAKVLLDIETDLNKVSNFLRAIAPMTKALESGSADNVTLLAITGTLGKLAKLTSMAQITDIGFEEVAE